VGPVRIERNYVIARKAHSGETRSQGIAKGVRGPPQYWGCPQHTDLFPLRVGSPAGEHYKYLGINARQGLQNAMNARQQLP